MILRRAFLAVIVVLLISGMEARAYGEAGEGGALAGQFCPALADPAAYEKDIAHYRILVPGRDGVVFRTGNDFRADWDFKDGTIDNLLALQDAFRAHNAELVIVIPPVRAMVLARYLLPGQGRTYGMESPDKAWDAYENAFARLRARGVNAIGFTRAQASGDFFYKRNHHWTAKAARAAAKNIAALLKTMPVYGKIPHRRYDTHFKETVPYKSTFNKAFERICNTDVPAEPADEYITLPAETAQTAEDMFGDAQAPQVVLVGTSNCVSDTSMANFEGFLKQYLSADVVNFAEVGAGLDESIGKYMASDHFASDLPKIVIWEIPGYYNLNTKGDFFKRLVAAAKGRNAQN